jgi:hypothetical protein
VEHADGGVALVQEEEEAVGEVGDPVAPSSGRLTLRHLAVRVWRKVISPASSGRTASPPKSATQRRGRNQ